MRDRLRQLAAPLDQRETRRLFGAQLVSGLGDWAGRLALAVVVFDRSGSAWWAAAVTLVSLVPWLGPGQVLSTFADRFGRVQVLIASDVVRAALFALMVAPLPVWGLLALAFLAGLCVPPFQSARGAAMLDVVPTERYGPTIALFGVAHQAELVMGYAFGGVLIATIGARATLALNAATFLASALLIATIAGSAAGQRRDDSPTGWAGVRAGAAVWRADPLCGRALVLFAGVNMLMVLPEALVVPYADELSAPTGTVGLLAAAIAIGSMTAMTMWPESDDPVELLRVAARRTHALGAAAAVLFTVALDLLPAIGVVALLATGAVDAIAVPTNQVVGLRLPREGRAAAMSVAGGVQYGSQATAIAVGGVLADVVGSGPVLAAASIGTCAVCAWSMLRPPRADGGLVPVGEATAPSERAAPPDPVGP